MPPPYPPILPPGYSSLRSLQPEKRKPGRPPKVRGPILTEPVITPTKVRIGERANGALWKQSQEHYDNHGKAEYSFTSNCHFCQIRAFSNWDTFPIAIINDEDFEGLPSDFRFTDRSISAKEVQYAAEVFKLGCECESDQDCLYNGCHCLQDMDEDDDRMDEDGCKIAYHAEGQQKGCLRDEILDSRDPIYECHNLCSCSESCANRVVQRGRQIPLTIFRTPDRRGWGVRSRVNIRKGQLVDRYLGEIISSQEALKRRAESDQAKRKDVYLFALDKFSDPESADERLRADPYEIDGEFVSGPTRFINHSCSPNMRIFAIVGTHADKHLHDLALFALQDIPAGQELTFDYVDGEETVDEMTKMNLDDSTQEGTLMKCLCGSRSCRGYLW